MVPPCRRCCGTGRTDYASHRAPSDRHLIVKRDPGYDPAHHDWFWITFSPAGEALAAWRLGGCINCHGAMRSNDFVITLPVATGP